MSSLESETLKKILLRLRDDPLAFVRHIINPPKISQDQTRFLAAAAKHNARVSVASGTTTGKTTTLSWLIWWFMMTRDEVRVPCTATKYDQVTKTLWPELAKWKAFMRPEFANMYTYKQEKLYRTSAPDRCFAWPMAAAKERVEGFQGVHAENVMFVFDEAAGIPEEVYGAARRSASTPGAKWIIAGNPNRASGAFYDSHHSKAEFWTRIVMSSINSPFCDPKYVEGMKKEFGEESNMYRIGVLGKFPKHDADTLIPFDWVEEALDRDVRPDKHQERIAGLDPSGGGADPVGFCIRQGARVYGFDEWQASEAMPTVGRVAAMWKEKLFDRIVVDAIGVGSGVVSRLEELKIPVVPVNVGMNTIMRPDCFRLRDELWWMAREWFESRVVQVSRDGSTEKMINKFVHEVSMPKMYRHSSGKIQIEDKDSLRKAGRLGYSPNIADAFCLTMAEGIPVRGKRFTPADIPMSRGDNYVW